MRIFSVRTIESAQRLTYVEAESKEEAEKMVLEQKVPLGSFIQVPWHTVAEVTDLGEVQNENL